MKRENRGVFRAGTSGLILPHPNKKSYPPEFQSQSRLSYYGSLFNSIEINSSFYQIPMASTLSKWTEMVPPDFRFTLKLWRGITHAKGFAFDLKEIDRFIRVADNVGSKKGCLLVQFPPSLTNKNAAQLEEVLERICHTDPGNSWKLAVEFRHTSWYTEDTKSLLNDYHAGIVLHDMPASATSTLNEAAPFVYLRYHGPRGDYRGSYPDDFLQSLAIKIKAWQAQGKDVYAYFNNTIGDALKNLLTLKGFVEN